MSDYTGMTVEVDGAAYTVHRETREAVIDVAIEPGAQREPRLATTLSFFDHMLEMLGWYADAAIDASYTVKTFRLTHTCVEDIGLALGLATGQLLKDRIADGVDSNGFAYGMMDEASALASISFEGRSNHKIQREDAAALEHVEDMLAADLPGFFEGFAQGARCSIHLRLYEATDPHHAWEAGFRAFARALRSALAANPQRAGRTAGVKGTLD